MTPFIVSESGLNRIKENEGFRSLPYGDYGQDSIGYGHKNNEGFFELSKDEASIILQKDIQERLNAFRDVINVDLNQNEVDAIADLSMSFSPAYIRSSSEAPAYINRYKAGTLSKDALREWWINYFDTAGGMFNEGLKTRRNNEIDLFLSPVGMSTGKKLLIGLLIVAGISAVVFFLTNS